MPGVRYVDVAGILSMRPLIRGMVAMAARVAGLYNTAWKHGCRVEVCLKPVIKW